MQISGLMAERIYLIGFMGAGKTTVGRLLAELLGWSFVDLDTEIQGVEGRSVADIFEDSGETHFRRVESEQLREVSRLRNRVVALGGGTYADPGNRAHVEESGLSVYLETALESIQDRIDDDGARPLFANALRMAELYRERLPSYRMASVTVNTDNLNPKALANRVFQIVSSL